MLYHRLPARRVWHLIVLDYSFAVLTFHLPPPPASITTPPLLLCPPTPPRPFVCILLLCFRISTFPTPQRIVFRRTGPGPPHSRSLLLCHCKGLNCPSARPPSPSSSPAAGPSRPRPRPDKDTRPSGHAATVAVGLDPISNVAVQLSLPLLRHPRPPGRASTHGGPQRPQPPAPSCPCVSFFCPPCQARRDRPTWCPTVLGDAPLEGVLQHSVAQ